MRLIRAVALIFVLQLLAAAELGATEALPGRWAGVEHPPLAGLSGGIFPPQERVGAATAHVQLPLLARNVSGRESSRLHAGDAAGFFKKNPQIFGKESRDEYSPVLLSCLAITGRVPSPGGQGRPGAAAAPPRAGPGAFPGR